MSTILKISVAVCRQALHSVIYFLHWLSQHHWNAETGWLYLDASLNSWGQIVPLYHIILAVFAVVILQGDSLNLSSNYCLFHRVSESWSQHNPEWVIHLAVLIKHLTTWLDSYQFRGLLIWVVRRIQTISHSCLFFLLFPAHFHKI